ncbi:MAG: heavy-metal-associated domain-containing protein [Candidatus Marinamargulisbacteria bacterium]
MFKDMKVVYAAGFILMTLFGVYYYQDILFHNPNVLNQKKTQSAPTTVADTVERKFNVAGMYCDSCRVKVETAVKALPGVQSVALDLESGEMKVVYNKSQETIQETLAAVKELGYTPGLKSNSGKLQVMDFNVTFK